MIHEFYNYAILFLFWHSVMDVIFHYKFNLFFSLMPIFYRCNNNYADRSIMRMEHRHPQCPTASEPEMSIMLAQADILSCPRSCVFLWKFSCIYHPGMSSVHSTHSCCDLFISQIQPGSLCYYISLINQVLRLFADLNESHPEFLQLNQKNCAHPPPQLLC